MNEMKIIEINIEKNEQRTKVCKSCPAKLYSLLERGARFPVNIDGNLCFAEYSRDRDNIISYEKIKAEIILRVINDEIGGIYGDCINEALLKAQNEASELLKTISAELQEVEKNKPPF